MLGKSGAKQVKKTITVLMLAMLALGSLAFIPTFANADTVKTSECAKVGGLINKWGNNSVFGWLKAFAQIVDDNGTIHEWARVQAMWTNETGRLEISENDTNDTVPAPNGTFTFSFYTARLVNTSMISLNASGYDFYVSGLWNVNKITTTLTIDENGTLENFTRTLEPIVTGAQGEFRVSNTTNILGLKPFELSINGIDPLSGYIRREVLTSKEIKMFDVEHDGEVTKVTIVDLVKVAKSYGSVPGMKGYSFDMDLNLEGRISISDVATIAANIEG